MNVINRLILLTIIFFLAVTTQEAESQQLVASATVNTDKIVNPDIKNKLSNLKNDLERYVNDFDWTDNAHRFDIPLQINVYIERAKPTSFEERYDARIVLSNGSDFQESDKRWTFAYMQGMQFPHGSQFHSLTGMLDFYIYILLGQEYDKLSKLGGISYYEKANEVVRLSKFSELFETGWKERQTKIERLLSEENGKLRELEYFFIQAKQRFRIDDRKTAAQYLKVIIIKLRDINRELDALSRFYQIHHLDLARLLSQLSMRTELEELAQLDQSNSVTYREFIEQIP